MKVDALALALLLSSCAFLETAAETGTVAGGAAAGGLVAGPAGAAAGAGATHAVIQARRSDVAAEDATGRLDDLVTAQLQAIVTGSTDPLEAALRNEAAARIQESHALRNWTLSVVGLLVLLYLCKQWVFGKRNARRLDEFLERAVEKAKEGIREND